MQKRQLGRTELVVSEICLGTMTFGQQTGEADAFAQMDYAVAQGVNFFDTAELYSIPPRAETYGATETIIGNWLKRGASATRSCSPPRWSGAARAHWYRNGATARLDRKNIFYAVEHSLKRLADRLYRSLPAALAGPADGPVRRPLQRLSAITAARTA